MGNSILSGTGKNSLNSSNVKDPYFPHRYVSDNAYEKYCWTGNRSWTENPQEIIYLPSSKKNYFPKFNWLCIRYANKLNYKNIVVLNFSYKIPIIEVNYYGLNKMLNSQTNLIDIGPWDANQTLHIFNLKYN